MVDSYYPNASGMFSPTPIPSDSQPSATSPAAAQQNQNGSPSTSQILLAKAKVTHKSKIKLIKNPSEDLTTFLQQLKHTFSVDQLGEWTPNLSLVSQNQDETEKKFFLFWDTTTCFNSNILSIVQVKKSNQQNNNNNKRLIVDEAQFSSLIRGFYNIFGQQQTAAANNNQEYPNFEVVKLSDAAGLMIQLDEAADQQNDDAKQPHQSNSLSELPNISDDDQDNNNSLDNDVHESGPLAQNTTVDSVIIDDDELYPDTDAKLSVVNSINIPSAAAVQQSDPESSQPDKNHLNESSNSQNLGISQVQIDKDLLRCSAMQAVQLKKEKSNNSTFDMIDSNEDDEEEQELLSDQEVLIEDLSVSCIEHHSSLQLEQQNINNIAQNQPNTSSTFEIVEAEQEIKIESFVLNLKNEIGINEEQIEIKKEFFVQQNQLCQNNNNINEETIVKQVKQILTDLVEIVSKNSQLDEEINQILSSRVVNTNNLVLQNSNQIEDQLLESVANNKRNSLNQQQSEPILGQSIEIGQENSKDQPEKQQSNFIVPPINVQNLNNPQPDLLLQNSPPTSSYGDSSSDSSSNSEQDIYQLKSQNQNNGMSHFLNPQSMVAAFQNLCQSQAQEQRKINQSFIKKINQLDDAAMGESLYESRALSPEEIQSMLNNSSDKLIGQYYMNNNSNSISQLASSNQQLGLSKFVTQHQVLTTKTAAVKQKQNEIVAEVDDSTSFVLEEEKEENKKCGSNDDDSFNTANSGAEESKDIVIDLMQNQNNNKKVVVVEQEEEEKNSPVQNWQIPPKYNYNNVMDEVEPKFNQPSAFEDEMNPYLNHHFNEEINHEGPPYSDPQSNPKQNQQEEESKDDIEEQQQNNNNNQQVVEDSFEVLPSETKMIQIKSLISPKNQRQEEEQNLLTKSKATVLNLGKKIKHKLYEHLPINIELAQKQESEFYVTARKTSLGNAQLKVKWDLRNPGHYPWPENLQLYPIQTYPACKMVHSHAQTNVDGYSESQVEIEINIPSTYQDNFWVGMFRFISDSKSQKLHGPVLIIFARITNPVQMVESELGLERQQSSDDPKKLSDGELMSYASVLTDEGYGSFSRCLNGVRLIDHDQFELARTILQKIMVTEASSSL